MRAGLVAVQFERYGLPVSLSLLSHSPSHDDSNSMGAAGEEEGGSRVPKQGPSPLEQGSSGLRLNNSSLHSGREDGDQHGVG